MSRLLFGALGAFLFFSFPCFAGDDLYQLDVGDELRLIVADHPELSGTFAINSEGFIGVPILDGVRIAGMTVDGAKTSIRKKIGSRILDVTLSLEITRHRPFFILGDVQRPGAYPWTPGVTAEVAVAVAGGYRSRSEFFAAAVTGVRAAETHANAAREFVAAWVERARLRAELEEAPTLVVSDVPPVPGQADQIREATSRQREIFEARKLAFAERNQLLRKDLSIRDNEISALEARSAAQQRLTEQLRTELTTIQDYVKRGLSPTSRLSELTREESRMQSDIMQVAVMMNQARQSRNQTELQLASLTRDYRIQILSALDETTARIERLKRQLQADEAVMVEANSTLELSDASTTFDIRRKSDGIVQRTKDVQTPVNAGDVVSVRSQSRDIDQPTTERKTVFKSLVE